MAKKIIKENELNAMYHHTGMTRFRGCQCFRDCSCREDFKSEHYDYYTVVRKNKKTTNHHSEEDANIRWDFVSALNNQK